MNFLETKDSLIKYSVLLAYVVVQCHHLISCILGSMDMLFCITAWLVGKADPRRPLYCDGNCSPLSDPLLCIWCFFLSLVQRIPHRILQNRQSSVQLGPESKSLRWISSQGFVLCPHFARIVTASQGMY